VKSPGSSYSSARTPLNFTRSISSCTNCCGHPTKKITRSQILEARETGSVLPFDELVKLRSPEMNTYEYEAESLASLIQEQVIRSSQIEQLTHGISSDKKVAESLKHLGLI
jgi:hypothetical protein